MKLEEVVYANLLRIAQADGNIAASEATMLERYRVALGVTRRSADELADVRDLPCPSELTESRTERMHIIEMMIRIAHADGQLTLRERRWLERLAVSLEIGPIELANILVRAVGEKSLRRSIFVSRGIGAIVVCGLLLVVWIVQSGLHHSFDERLNGATETTTRRETELLGRIEKLEADLLEADSARAERDAEKVRETRRAMKRSEASLAARLQQLEAQRARTPASAQKSKAAQTNANAVIADLRRELAQVRSINAVFQDIEREFARSVLLIYSRYELVKGRHRVRRWTKGTGFFISRTGYIVTAKHVVQNWLFSAEALRMKQQGYRLDTSRYLLAAWPAGKIVKQEDNHLDLDTAFHTLNNSLRVFKLAPDKMVLTDRRLSDGSRYTGRFHALDHHDIAILEAEVHGEVTPAMLAPNGHRMSKLDPVMVLGFPGSISVRESRRAETAPSLGEIRKIEDSIFVTAPIVPGNSGGPLIDSRGYVIGIASASYGASTVGGCIPIRHAISLLPVSVLRQLRRRR